MKINNPWEAPGTAKISILSTHTPQCSLFIFWYHCSRLTTCIPQWVLGKWKRHSCDAGGSPCEENRQEQRAKPSYPGIGHLSLSAFSGAKKINILLTLEMREQAQRQEGCAQLPACVFLTWVHLYLLAPVPARFLTKLGTHPDILNSACVLA